MAPEHNASLREPRNYPEQPPVIPHETDGYIIDANSNKCLSCHARRAHRGIPGADGQHHPFHGPRRPDSWRRYRRDATSAPNAMSRSSRCTPPVENDFVDIDSLLRGSTEQQ